MLYPRRPFFRPLVRFFLLFGLAIWSAPTSAAEIISHPPTRPLPQAADRPLADGPARYVDARRGDDAAEGTQARPWRTVQHGVNRLGPGETLYLRGGVYYEHLAINKSGAADRPLTIRSYPGELAVLDGGLPEFQLDPKNAWEPCPNGAPGEFRSTRTYPQLGGRPDETNLLGAFADSMVPLHGYRFRGDLQTDNPYWNIDSKVQGEQHVYCGPGLWYDVDTGRIHVRLAHTRLEALGDDNYRGPSDPRTLPLIVAGFAGGPVLELQNVAYVRLQDLVLRGAREATLRIADSRQIELDGLTIYGGSAPVQVRDSRDLRMFHVACRGLAAPWTFRGSLKYRAIESRLFSASGWSPTGNDSERFEIAWCEFTDSVDGVFIGAVRGVRFHHNLVDNVSDDGIFLTSATGYDGRTHGGDVWIHHNLLSRCLTTFAFGVGHGRQKVTTSGRQTGSGVYIFRNVFDFRRPVMYHWPAGPETTELTSHGRVAGDHGGPVWEPMWIYHNTILSGDPPRYNYGTDGLSGGMGHGTSRRVFNNILYQKNGLPGEFLPDVETDFQADGNLFWSAAADASSWAEQFLSKFRKSPAFEQSKKTYPPGWTANDRFAGPGLVRYSASWQEPLDLRLTDQSIARHAGVKLPAEWPDFHLAKESQPDIGALPHGATPWRIGVEGRLDVAGNPVNSGPKSSHVASSFRSDLPDPARFAARYTASEPSATSDSRRAASAVKPAAVVQGYPAFDAPLIEFALRRHGVSIASFERTWVEPREFSKYSLVAIDGSFTRAGIEPNRFREEDLPHVRSFLNNGGTLLLMRERHDLFATDDGRLFLESIVGSIGRLRNPQLEVLLPDHPWVRGLPKGTPAWLKAPPALPLAVEKGESVIGSANGASALLRVPVGKGQLIYFGWSPAAALPQGRRPGTAEDEVQYEQQYQVLERMLGSIYQE